MAIPALSNSNGIRAVTSLTQKRIETAKMKFHKMYMYKNHQNRNTMLENN